MAKGPIYIERLFEEIAEQLEKYYNQKQLPQGQQDNPPGMFDLVLINDNETSSDFVVDMLVDVFYFTYEKAAQIMADAHQKGHCVIATYTHDVAHSKYAIVQDYIDAWNQQLKIEIWPHNSI